MTVGGVSAQVYVRRMSGWLPTPLVPERSISAAVAAAERLPAALGGYFGFECPLGAVPAGAQEHGADFLVGVRHPDRHALAAVRGPGVAWRRVARFAQEWSSPGSVLAERVQNMWLEFDSGSDVVAAEAPSVFFGTDRVGPGAARAEGLQWLTQEALPLLSGGRLPAAQEAAVTRCVDALPPTGSVYQVGRMLGRPGGATRLCLDGVAPTEVPGLLRAVGLGDRRDVVALLDGLAPLVDRIDVDLDVADGLGPRVGLECYFLPRLDPDQEPRWRPLVEQLVHIGSCSTSRGAALLSSTGWGTDDVVIPHQQPMRQMDLLLGRRTVGVRSRRMHHVKVVSEPGHPPTAKAYLEIAHRLVSVSSLNPSRVAR